MADREFTCKDCFFWVDRNIIGVCQRYPQQVNKARSEWCGEFKAVKAEESTEEKRKPGRPKKNA